MRLTIDDYLQELTKISIESYGRGGSGTAMEVTLFAMRVGEELSEVYEAFYNFVKSSCVCKRLQNDLILELGDYVAYLTLLVQATGLELGEIVGKASEKVTTKKRSKDPIGELIKANGYLLKIVSNETQIKFCSLHPEMIERISSRCIFTGSTEYWHENSTAFIDVFAAIFRLTHSLGLPDLPIIMAANIVKLRRKNTPPR
jgi:phosphoribosyl-ATP pyrophosphohydrolase